MSDRQSHGSGTGSSNGKPNGSGNGKKAAFLLGLLLLLVIVGVQIARKGRAPQGLNTQDQAGSVGDLTSTTGAGGDTANTAGSAQPGQASSNTDDTDTSKIAVQAPLPGGTIATFGAGATAGGAASTASNVATDGTATVTTAGGAQPGAVGGALPGAAGTSQPGVAGSIQPSTPSGQPGTAGVALNNAGSQNAAAGRTVAAVGSVSATQSFNKIAPGQAAREELAGAGKTTAPGSAQTPAGAQSLAKGDATKVETAAPAAPVPPPQTCFVMTYHHKKMKTHTNEEACSRHKNQFALKHSQVAQSSLCVRVNHTPVHFTLVPGKAGVPDEVQIGAIAGPNAVVTASYCIGKSTCNQDCTVPRDEFLEAIGGAEETAANGPVGRWDLTDASNDGDNDKVAAIDKDLKKEFQELDQPSADGQSAAVFRDWLADNDTPAPSCSAHAENDTRAAAKAVTTTKVAAKIETHRKSLGR